MISSKNDTHPFNQFLIIRIRFRSNFVNNWLSPFRFFGITPRDCVVILYISTIYKNIFSFCKGKIRLLFIKIYGIFTLERTVPI